MPVNSDAPGVRKYRGEAGLDFEDLVTALEPPPNRVGKSDGVHEHHLYEGAVMVAYARYLLRTQGARNVRVHPDGEHGKQFDFTGWLGRRTFAKVSSLGSTAYGGIYRNPTGQTITINPKSGVGDVVADVGDHIISAARAASSTRGIQAKCRGSIAAFVRRSEC